MAALSGNINIPHLEQELAEVQLGAAVRVYRNALLGISSLGYVGPYGATVSTQTFNAGFVGIAYDGANNTSGSNGDTAMLDSDGNETKKGKLKIYTVGDFELTLTAACALTDIGKHIVAVTDNQLDCTLGDTGNMTNASVGRIVAVTSTSSPYKIRVRLRSAFAKE